MSDNKTIIIGLAGEIACGKGTVAQYLSDRGGVEYKFSDILKGILQRVHLDLVRENFSKLSIGLRKYYGQDILAYALAEEIKKDDARIIIVDGVRREADLKYLKELDNFVFVFITAEERVRYERLNARNEKQDDQAKTFEQFQKDAKAETEKTIAGLKNIADVIIDNSGTLEQLYKQIDKIIQ